MYTASGHLRASLRGCLCGVFGIMGTAAITQAANVTFDGGAGTGSWHTAANWDTDLLPGSGDVAIVPVLQNVTYSTGSTTIQNLQVDPGGNLTIAGGTLATTSSAATTLAGSVVHSNGTLNLAGWVQAGGNMHRSGGTLLVNGHDAGRSIVVQNSTITTANSASILRTAGGVVLGDGVAVSTFSVSGSGATEIGIGTAGSVDGSWVQLASGRLHVRIDTTAAGIEPILIADRGDTSLVPSPANRDGNVSFAPGSLLDVAFVGAENLGTFTIMTWEGSLLENGLAFAPSVDTSVWSFAVNGKSLQVTAVPEPSCVAAIALLGASMSRGFGRGRRAAKPF